MSQTEQELAIEALQAEIGAEPDIGEWFHVTQKQINSFADATHDHQFIHVDPEQAANTPFGGTIAHGFLTLSMLVHLSSTMPAEALNPKGLLMVVNYGLNKVRFISPVPVDSKIRASAVVSSVEPKGTSVDVTRTFTVEIEGQDKPAMVAEWIGRLIFG